MKKHRIAKLLVSGLALASSLVTGLAAATPAHASPKPSIELFADGSIAGRWDADGLNFAPGLSGGSGVELWVRDLTTETVIEWQGDLPTTPGPGYECFGPFSCVAWAVGAFYAQGTLSASGQTAEHPLQCANTYQAAAYDPADGWVYSNELTEPACRYVPLASTK
jgi:hypothetical protein